MICVIWEVLVLQVGKYYNAACHVTWEVLGPMLTSGSFAIVIRDTYLIIIFRLTLCFAIRSKFVYCTVSEHVSKDQLGSTALRPCSRSSGSHVRGCICRPIVDLWLELELRI
jgi:hypothetical protein